MYGEKARGMIPKVVEYGMVVIQGKEEKDARLYGYVVLVKYKCNLTTYLKDQDSIDELDALDITK